MVFEFINKELKMLLKKTVVKVSPIAGVGLFADQDIKKGEIVWQYTPESCTLLTEEQLDVLVNSFHKTEKDLIKYYLTYSYFQKFLNSLVFCLDNGRYVNHSEEPNLVAPTDLPYDVAWQYSVALRDIKKGEELTENYNSYDPAEWVDTFCQKFGIFHFQNQLAAL